MKFTDEQQRYIDERYQLLPKDADGEPIRIGDMLEEVDHDSRGSVGEMRMLGDGWWVITNGIGMRPDSYRHYKQPSVEDVLRDMLYKAHIYDEREMEMLPDLIAEYAAKLRLAGDTE